MKRKHDKRSIKQNKDDIEQLSTRQLLTLDRNRHYSVLAGNPLIQATSSHLTVNQRKIILHLIQMINKNTKNLTFRFNVHDYAEFIGINPNVTNIKSIMNQMKALYSKSFWYRYRNKNTGKHVDKLRRWFSNVEYVEEDHEFIVQFESYLKKFLLRLKAHFTSFDYSNVIDMRRTYSIKLYELLVSRRNQENAVHGYRYSIPYLRFALLGKDSKRYKRFCDFNRRVIKPGVHEINDKTNLRCRVYPIKKGHTTIGLRFKTESKPKSEIEEIRNRTDYHLMRNQKEYRRAVKFAKQHRIPRVSTAALHLSKMDKKIDIVGSRTLRKYLDEFRHGELQLDKQEVKRLKDNIVLRYGQDNNNKLI